MHELGHIVVLVFTLCGLGSLLLLMLWPVLADRSLDRSAKAALGVVAALGAASLLVEWVIVH